jgi:hypothetical protein
MIVKLGKIDLRKEPAIEALKALINSLSQGGLDSYDLNEAKLAIMKAEGRTL